MTPSLMAKGKNPSTKPETQKAQVRFLGWEDLLEEGMAICSSILTWRIPWTEEPHGLCTVHRVASNQGG